MNKWERMIVRIWGHSNDAFGLLTIPTLLFTLMVAVLAVLMPEHKSFWFGVWCMCGIVQAVGVSAAIHIRTKKPRRR